MAEDTKNAETPKGARKEKFEGVGAAPSESDRLSGPTHADDATYQGVKMVEGSSSEGSGPEDALGIGNKRGDYRDRIKTDANQVVPAPEGGIETPGGVAAAVIVDQNARAEDIGDEEGVKGGTKTVDSKEGKAEAKKAAAALSKS